MNDDRDLAHLHAIAAELREIFARERTAIATLDHDLLTYCVAAKQAIAERLATIAVPDAPAPELRTVLEALQIEAQATAMLAATAAQAVRSLLGYEQNGAYDRRARTQTSAPRRTLAAR